MLKAKTVIELYEALSTTEKEKFLLAVSRPECSAPKNIKRTKTPIPTVDELYRETIAVMGIKFKRADSQAAKLHKVARG